MPLVRMTTQISGSRDGADWPAPGQTVDVPADEAQGLVAAGLAEVETAEAPRAGVETAVAPASKRRG